MSNCYQRYLEKLEELRVLRLNGQDRNDETAILDEMDKLWDMLTESERKDMRNEGWRIWPWAVVTVHTGYTNRALKEQEASQDGWWYLMAEWRFIELDIEFLIHYLECQSTEEGLQCPKCKTTGLLSFDLDAANEVLRILWDIRDQESGNGL